MRRELLLPKLGLTMTEGTLVEWMIAPGQGFKKGQSIFVIESDKAATEIEAESDGTLLEATAPLGELLPTGTVLGYWEDGAAGEAAEMARVPVTPYARVQAKERGIDLSQVTGSGPSGRIRARDLPAARVAAIAGLRKPTPNESTIARRLTESKQQIPHFYLALEAEVSELLAVRAELNAVQQEIPYTLNHLIVAAVGRALTDMPQLNRVWTDDGILTLETSDVGVATDTERGLMAPVLRDVGRKPLLQVAQEASAAIDRARKGQLPATEMAGGSITVSNAGMHGVTYMSSIINPGQSMILGVGGVRELFRPDAAGQPKLVKEIGLVLSADHRVQGGVAALSLLQRVVAHLENPRGLILS